MTEDNEIKTRQLTELALEYGGLIMQKLRAHMEL